MAEKTTVGGIPVECLTGESAAIWSGWRILGDRELIREASVKGTHINLAYKCLAFRKSCTIEDAQHYFNREVETWLTELLRKQQIYRASHILNNLNRDPVEHIFKVCISCKDSVLRDYLSQYLINVTRFESEHINSWNIIKSIVQYEQKHMVEDGLSSSLCIGDVMNIPTVVKQALCTEICFSVVGNNLSDNLNNHVLWDYLLSNNRIQLIKFWIDTCYGGNAAEGANEIDEVFKSLITNFNVLPDMIEVIDFSNASALVKDLAKNYLSRHGIFVQTERQDIKLLLARIFASTMTISEFNTILSSKSCNIDGTAFIRDIDKELCLAYCLNQVNAQREKAQIAGLYDALTKMCKSQDKLYDSLIEGIYETIRYLSDDSNEYLEQNFLVVFISVFSYLFNENARDGQNENVTIKNIFTMKNDLTLGAYNILNEVLQSTLKQVPMLEGIIENKSKEEATIYELLNGYKNLNAEKLYKWRFNDEPMPHFSDENLVKKYGHTEELTYEYYLKEARPNMALFSLKLSKGKIIGHVSSRRKQKAALYAQILALRNLDKPEVLCTCIPFIEMLGMDSENLRLHITVAKYVRKEMNITIENLLENVIHRNEEDLKTVLSYLEISFQKNLIDDLVEDNQRFENALKTWDIIVRFANAHNFSLPVTLLKYLAGQNHWFEFVLVCHIFDYPLSQVLENTKHFEDVILREHLLTCLSNKKLVKSQLICNDLKITSRDTRQSLYCKIGVKQSESPTSGSPVSIDSASISDSQSICEYNSSDDICFTNDDLWSIILKCHESPDPPGALINSSRLTSRPFLTVLATSYEPSSTAAYCYSWIAISAADEEILNKYNECLEQQVWTANQVSDLIYHMVTHGYISVLNKAYKIFMPEYPLNLFFEFLAQCVVYGDFKECQQELSNFKTECINFKCNKAMDWNCSDSTYLNNLYWVAVIATKCIIATLSHNLQSKHLQIRFIEILIRCNFFANFPVSISNFQSIPQIIKILQKSKVTLNFAVFGISDNVYNFDKEISRCADSLLELEDYDSALELSHATGLNSSEIILAQYRSRFKSYMLQNDKIEDSFWNECASSFKKYQVSYEKAAAFFIEHAEKVTSHKERYEILSLAFETLKNVEAEQETINTLEIAMWKSCILADPENVHLERGPYIFNKLKIELLSGLDKLEFGYALINPNEKNATEKLINKLIDLGKLDTALRISTIFNYKHKDLEILMLCLSLAENEILPNELTVEQQNLLKETNKNKQQKYSALKNRGLQRFSSTSSLIASINVNEITKQKEEGLRKTQLECLSILQRSLDTLEHGLDICLRIVLCYKLAIQLSKTYQMLLTLNVPIKFLQEVTESDVKDKSEVICDIITAYKIDNDTVATFLAENITTTITRAVEGGHQDNVYLWGYSLNTNFHVITELCNDVSLLGWKILKTANKLLGKFHSEKRHALTLKTVVELLIPAHDCFTTACNMEGIASVLRKCQNLANILQNLKCWTLLVRLVTGVGRFTEMNYVFQILKENDQFEFLLGKGLDKVIGLKTALLEFLKRNCPENKDLFTLVALHFRLYQEIALMWENEAKCVISALISDATKEQGKLQSTVHHGIQFTKSENVQKQLNLAVTNYTHATQYYLQANKLNLASQSSDQVQLVTLQLSLFNSASSHQQVICILNLKPEDIDKVLCNNLNFSQALIIIHAYNHHIDWANLIYNRCILNGETKYLKDFIAVNKLTPGLAQDCVRRYRLEKSITHTMTDNMKILISELSDVECKYAFASQLGFKSIIETMLNNPMIGAYLKDTVWKKGYSAI